MKNFRKRKSSIVFIINSLYPAGAERLVVDDINELMKKGVDVRLITLKKEKQGFTLENECCLGKDRWVVIPFGGLFDFHGFFKLLRVIKGWKPQAVITHLWFANTVGRLAAWLAGVKTIISFEHNIYTQVKSKKQFLADRVLARLSNKIIAVSEAVKKTLILRGIPEEKIAALYNGLVLEHYQGISKNESREKLGVGENDFIFLFVGRLTKQKGADILLGAFNKIKDGLLLIVGDGEDRQKLEKTAFDLKIDNRVRFLGVRRDIPELLAAADCFILPSRWEGLGIVILEAMAAGKPIIASAVDGIKELITSGENGILVKSEDAEEFSRTMEKIRNDQILRDRLAKNALNSVQKFSIQNHVEKLLEITKP